MTAASVVHSSGNAPPVTGTDRLRRDHPDGHLHPNGASGSADDLHGHGHRRHGHRRATPMAAPATWTFTTSRATTCPCTILDAVGHAGPSAARRRHRPGRAGREVPHRHRRLHHRRPLLQGRRQHRHPHRQPVDRDGTRLATATFTGETATGWQQVSFANPVAVTAARPTSPATTRPTAATPSTPTPSAPAGAGTARCGRWPTASTAATASTATAGGVPDQHLQRRQLLGGRRVRPTRPRPTPPRRP